MTGTDDVTSIEGVIQSYLDGLHEGDAGKDRERLSSDQRADQRLRRRRTGDHAARRLAGQRSEHRPSPKQRGLPRHDQVLSIDLIGPTMAYVRLKCAIPPRFFTDQLSLLKIDGRWQIAQKVFMTEMRD